MPKAKEKNAVALGSGLGKMKGEGNRAWFN
jgi:hypothetical protein